MDYCAFDGYTKLIRLSVPQHTQIGEYVIGGGTALMKASPFPIDSYVSDEEVIEWIKSRHEDNQFTLHRACSSYNPLDEVVFDIVKRQSLKAFKKKDSVGVTPSQYLSENPFTEIKDYQTLSLGEIV
ncbi:predicted protein [Chaetoceros tenuissimus]|uniref:Uncharacterized protein n=1 Tax=Chaetoceros tenuissimus TaxID=426638 RepID=A0AAD3CP61_9STRA|nr:predicted protein [Chaetoceros tenuissimus]